MQLKSPKDKRASNLLCKIQIPPNDTKAPKQSSRITF